MRLQTTNNNSRRYFENYYYAKFWRKQQDHPTHWILVPEGGRTVAKRIVLTSTSSG